MNRPVIKEYGQLIHNANQLELKCVELQAKIIARRPVSEVFQAALDVVELASAIATADLSKALPPEESP